MIKRPCLQPDCREYIDAASGESRCPAHKLERTAKRKATAVSERRTGARGMTFSPGWGKLRWEIYASQHGRCGKCAKKLGKSGWTCHHRDGHADGPGANDPSNLEVLCTDPCAKEADAALREGWKAQQHARRMQRRFG
jgi:hypothetical protein